MRHWKKVATISSFEVIIKPSSEIKWLFNSLWAKTLQLIDYLRNFLIIGSMLKIASLNNKHKEVNYRPNVEKIKFLNTHNCVVWSLKAPGRFIVIRCVLIQVNYKKFQAFRCFMHAAWFYESLNNPFCLMVSLNCDTQLVTRSSGVQLWIWLLPKTIGMMINSLYEY